MVERLLLLANNYKLSRKILCGLLSSTNERKKHIVLTYHMSYEYIIAYLIGVKIGK